MTHCARRCFDRHLLAGLIVAVALASVHSQSSDQRVRPRTIVTTDPELDDSNSLVRFLLYSAGMGRPEHNRAGAQIDPAAVRGLARMAEAPGEGVAESDHSGIWRSRRDERLVHQA
jgi:hypothetical protein